MIEEHNSENDCPNLENCPFPDLVSDTSSDTWKIIYCFGDSMKGFRNCARYKYRLIFKQPPPLDLYPDS